MGDLQDNVEVPPFFVCPISLDIMKDPVTLATGITYDRDSIEKWLFSAKNNVCPVTKQVLIDTDLTPNHTLRRLIQSWCTINASSGIERFPTPRLPISKAQIVKLLKDSKYPHLQTKCLKKLKAIVLGNETNKRLMESVGAADRLTSILINTKDGESPDVDALTVLYHIRLSPTGLKGLFGKTGEFVTTLTRMMNRDASYESRTYAVMLLKSMFEASEPKQTMPLLLPRFFIELVRILTDQISEKATKAALKLLINICPQGRNRVKAAEAGAVSVLIDTLLDCNEKRVSEMAITVLDRLCECAEGRSEVLKHGGGLAVVSKKIFRVSAVTSELAVRVLYSISRFSGNGRVLEEMLELGVVGKLCLVLQVDCGRKMKEKAMEILKMNAWVWKTSSCIDYKIISSHPC